MSDYNDLDMMIDFHDPTRYVDGCKCDLDVNYICELCMTYNVLREAKRMLMVRDAEIERLMEEITDGDYWHKRATQAIENGTCPICFSGDEGGHKDGCLWGEAEDRADQLEEEIERLRTENKRLRQDTRLVKEEK